MSDVNAFPTSTFANGGVTVNDAANWVLVATMTMYGIVRNGLLSLSNGAGGALANLKFTRSGGAGGPDIDWYQDSDFNVATAEFPSTQPTNIYQLAANAKGAIKLANLAGVHEVKIWAKKASADTVLTIIGTFERE